MKRVIEASYPITFRSDDASQLGSHIKHGNSVSLIGMKRVGISNFLRFFLYHPDIDNTYIRNGIKHLFVHVDLNDLIERDIFPFWTLLLTRIVDSVQKSDLPETLKRRCRRLFVQSIQLKDHFFTLDSVQKVISVVHDGGMYPTLFLIRFDRLADAITPEFFSNLVGVRDAAKHKLSYVFTSARPLPDLSPDVIKKQHLSVFSHDMYLKPARAEDMRVILATLEEQYHASLAPSVRDCLVALSGGLVQYVQLAIIRLRQEAKAPASCDLLEELLVKDEQIAFQSEELFESLTKTEKDVLLRLRTADRGTWVKKDDAPYLWNTGMVTSESRGHALFSPLFARYVASVTVSEKQKSEFTKKEHLLFMFLKHHEGQLCEREAIIEAVWPENAEFGVSDWAIDRLVARLRGKLKLQQSRFQIVTVVTRGYKLIRA